MRTFEARSTLTLIATTWLASACGDPGASPGGETIAVSRQSIITVEGTDMPHVWAALNAASAGQTVFFPAGEYVLLNPPGKTVPFLFKTGVAYVGDPAGTSVLKWLGATPLDQTTLRLDHVGAEAVKNVAITNLTFENIALSFQGTQTNLAASSNVYLKHLTFYGGKGDNWNEYGYVSAKYSDGVVVDDCTLLRSSKAEGGKGIRSYWAHNTIIKDSFIGTTKHLEPGAPNGYVATAVHVLGQQDGGRWSRNVKVHGTVIRHTQAPCTAECEDHPIYAAYYDGLELTQNRIDGFSATDDGTSKLKNSDSSFVFRNHFMNSGIFFQAENDPQDDRPPEHLFDVRVRGNRFQMFGCNTAQCGIRVWREGSLNDPDTVYEQNIYLTDNTFVNGGPIYLLHLDGSEVCVENNVGATNVFNEVTPTTSGCPESWDRPLAGVFSGDFNEDGIADTAIRARVGDAWSWRVYVSNGEHHQMLDFGNGAGTLVLNDAERYGVHVGDFTEDGKDDIMYRGVCGEALCWRVQASNGTSFVTKTGFGDQMFTSDETFRFGFHVGDFDGDGFKDDLVYRGKCGSPGVPCWRVHKSNGSTFSTHNFGDSAKWFVENGKNESEIYGLLIGNFDGDAGGKDDIAYLGKCDNSSGRCMRVHLSTGSAFVYQSNWGQGAGVLRDGPEITEHFGMRVGDMPEEGDGVGDGKADIAYRGRCGSSSQWRYHKTNASGTGFDVVCDDSYLF